jgi:hypothetical protein
MLEPAGCPRPRRLPGRPSDGALICRIVLGKPLIAGDVGEATRMRQAAMPRLGTGMDPLRCCGHGEELREAVRR